jgi:hypothetical protein
MPKPEFGAFNQGDIPKIAVFNKWRWCFSTLRTSQGRSRTTT